MSIYHAVLLDTVSIQKYVFQSNKLRENLGASFLVEEMYKKYLNDAVVEVFKRSFDLDAWKKEPSVLRIHDEPFEVGYVGGGNALLLFQEKEKAEYFIKEWTTSLLIHTPGIIPAVALSEFDSDNFKDSKENIFRILRKNKSEYVPETIIPRHGITSECPHSGFSMDIWNSTEQKYVSASTNAKIEASGDAKRHLSKLAQEYLPEHKEKLENEFCFTDHLEKLGGMHGEDSHIAIVHIDGNSMGDRFKKMAFPDEIRKLSITVDKATQNAFFCGLLRSVIGDFKGIMESLGFDNAPIYPHGDFKLTEPCLGALKENSVSEAIIDKLRKLKGKTFPTENNLLKALKKTVGNSLAESYKHLIFKHADKKKVIPIRPIILGGDDVTFVCDGKLGIYFSKLFMESFEKKRVSDEKPLSACAGIAVIKTKYPFHRGYTLAEKLCENAKKKRRNNRDSCSYIDFHISTGGIAGTLEHIRKKYYEVSRGTLMYRPYKLVSKDQDERSFDLFVKNTGMLRKRFPKNKIHELRQVLSLSEETALQFVREAKFRERELPEIPERNYHISLFENKITPYFDMIELGAFYPDFVWNPTEASDEKTQT
ncbi:hypothetical protein QUF80_01470 [Desulfococcaceae bacterium HSG8]|nr:hypothetical protein [Desulfococcaceae bacterium HSG8]